MLIDSELTPEDDGLKQRSDLEFMIIEVVKMSIYSIKFICTKFIYLLIGEQR